VVFVILREQDIDGRMGGVTGSAVAMVEVLVSEEALTLGTARIDGMSRLMVRLIPWNLNKRSICSRLRPMT